MHLKLLLLTLLPLPGCLNLTMALWKQKETEVTLENQERAVFAVEAVGVGEDDHTDAAGQSATAQGLVVAARRTGGRCASQLSALPEPCWFRLELEDAGGALALAGLLTSEPLGPIGCTIELEWTLSHAREPFWAGRIEVRGELSPRLRDCALDEPAAMDLLASRSASIDDNVPELPRCIAAAEHLDWRVLLPWETDGSGCVLGRALRACHDAPAAGIDGIDLLVRVGARPPHRYLRVPAAVTPVLAAVQRDPTTLFDRFVFRARCQVRPVREPRAAMLAPRHAVFLSLATNVEGMHRRVGWLEKVLMTPFTVTADVAAEVLLHGCLRQALLPLSVRGGNR